LHSNDWEFEESEEEENTSAESESFEPGGLAEGAFIYCSASEIIRANLRRV
jgi:hypothetical protein